MFEVGKTRKIATKVGQDTAEEWSHHGCNRTIPVSSPMYLTRTLRIIEEATMARVPEKTPER